MAMTMKIDYLRHGARLGTFEARAVRAGIIGIERDGAVYKPCIESVAAAAPYAIRKAIKRELTFWQSANDGYDVLRMDLTSTRGEPMGALIARLSA